MLNKITNSIIESSSSIIYTLKKMDNIGTKILYVFDDTKFIGIVTIGDIQRAIIKNVSLDATIKSILDKNKVYAKEDEPIEKIKSKMMGLRSESMPIINEKGDLVDVYFWKDIFSINEEISRDKIDLPVVIMAGGVGQRLKPLTNVIPKPLIPVGEKTILETIMDQFREIGSNKFYISVNYKYDIIKYYLSKLDTKYDVNYFREKKPLGTIGSVSLLKGKIDSPFFVTNCDILIDQDYRDVHDYHIKNKNEITIVTSIKSYSIPYGVIETGENGLLKEIKEKPEMTYMINTGVYILNPELIDEIPENLFFHITDLMEKVKARGGKIGCFPVSEKSWTDIGDWNEYLRLLKIR